ncbi:MAG: hypothetical protein ACKOYM_07100 [Actinomycetes bacterium]
MPQLGLDPQQLGVLAKSLQRESGTIRTLARQLDGQLRAAWWQGPDADKFRSQWDGEHRTQLERVATSLDTAATAVTANVAQQTQASQS